MEAINNAVVVYSSVWEAIQLMPEETRWKAIKAILEYGFFEQVPETDDPMVKMVLIQAMPTIVAAQKRHLAAVENGAKGRDFGVEGGRPEKVSADAVAILKQSGLTHAQISEELEVSISTVKKKLKEYNMKEDMQKKMEAHKALTANNPLR